MEETQVDSKQQNKRYNPKRPPLHFLPIIMPRVTNGPGLRLIESLFQQNNTIFPEVEAASVAINRV